MAMTWPVAANRSPVSLPIGAQPAARLAARDKGRRARTLAEHAPTVEVPEPLPCEGVGEGSGFRLDQPGVRALAVILAGSLSACAAGEAGSRPIAGADAAQGLATLQMAGCPACHDVPGVAWPRTRVGGTLAGFADRPLIAGRFPNQPDILVRWLRDAPSLSPETGMPASGLGDAEARDVAAYLYTLHD